MEWGALALDPLDDLGVAELRDEGHVHSQLVGDRTEQPPHGQGSLYNYGCLRPFVQWTHELLQIDPFGHQKRIMQCGCRYSLEAAAISSEQRWLL